jgi:hypothetical protein
MDDRKTALFREVNESMIELLLQFGADEEASFFCECPVRDCARRVPLTRIEYEGIRRGGGFLVSPDCRQWARVVLRTERYVVVEDFRPRLTSVTEASAVSPSAAPGAGQARSPAEPGGSSGPSPTAPTDSLAAA